MIHSIVWRSLRFSFVLPPIHKNVPEVFLIHLLLLSLVGCVIRTHRKTNALHYSGIQISFSLPFSLSISFVRSFCFVLTLFCLCRSFVLECEWMMIWFAECQSPRLKSLKCSDRSSPLSLLSPSFYACRLVVEFLLAHILFFCEESSRDTLILCRLPRFNLENNRVSFWARQANAP